MVSTSHTERCHGASLMTTASETTGEREDRREPAIERAGRATVVCRVCGRRE